MKKIYCELHLFDLHQKIYILDTETNQLEVIAAAPIEGLAEAICAACHSNDIINVTLTGNSIFGLAMSEDIAAYNKTHYSWDKDIEVEVIK
jgi:hypothetical protein